MRHYIEIKASSEEEAEQKSSGLDGFRTLKSIELVNEAFDGVYTDEGYVSYDSIAQSEFGMDYDQLGPNEKEWVRDEIGNLDESINEGKEKWVVYDIETKKRLPNPGKSWATMKAAQAFADKQKNADVASDTWYFDKIKESVNERLASMVREVYSEKQRRWACAQDDPKFDEMCKDTAISKKKIKEYSIMEKEDLTKSEKKKLKKVSSQLKKSVKAHDKQSKIIDKALKETGMDKAKKNMDNYKKQNRLTELIKDALKNPKKADLNKDGKLSDYEKKRGAAIEKSMQKESYMMSVDSNVNSAVLQALSVLKHANIDGETMQYILEELGMDEQMWKQLNVKYGTPESEIPLAERIFKKLRENEGGEKDVATIEKLLPKITNKSEWGELLNKIVSHKVPALSPGAKKKHILAVAKELKEINQPEYEMPPEEIEVYSPEWWEWMKKFGGNKITKDREEERSTTMKDREAETRRRFAQKGMGAI